MKKIIMVCIIILLIVIAYLMIFENFKIGNFTIKSVKDIEALDNNLQNTIQEANKKISQEYVSQLEFLKSSIKNLETSKEEYEKYNAQGEAGLVQIDNYKIEYLWTTIGNYAKNRNVVLTLDLVETTQPGSYDLNFKLVGDYVDITDCISDIENDDSFNFKISNFVMEPYLMNKVTTEVEQIERVEEKETELDKYLNGTVTTTITTERPYEESKKVQEVLDTKVASQYDPFRVVAAFQVKNVGIILN